MSDDINYIDFSDKNHDLRISTTRKFTDDYKAKVFQIWYNAGKPVVQDLHDMIPFPETNYGNKPNMGTLSNWISDFRERAEELDLQVREKADSALVAAKVEMLERHAQVGREAQKIALDYLRTADLTPSAAVRLLVDGVAIERGSAGIPEALAKLVGLSDEQLLEELKKEIENSSIESIEPNE